MSLIRFAGRARATRLARRIGLLFALLLFSGPILALQQILGFWQIEYPNSNTDDIGGAGSGCQVCHQNSNGGEPWNAYGWEIRQRINNGFEIDQAIRFIGDEDQDGNGIQNLDEINDDFQPGWTEGPNNTLYFANGSTQTGQMPPSAEPTTGIDHPDPIADPLPDIPTGALGIALHEVATDFNAPVKAVKAPGIEGSLFVAEQTGKIFRVDLATGAKTLFFDTAANLVTINPGYDERGLLGLAFHPQFASNGRFYTYESQPFDMAITPDFSTMPSGQNPDHRSALVEYRASDPNCNSFVRKQSTLMLIDQSQGNHNGGDLIFDAQGLLYVSVGDGGASNDDAVGHGARGNGRDNTNVLGTILRIDVDGNNSANGEYGIPVDNPFTAMADPGSDEIYAYGFRNVFRFSFDSLTGDLYAGDVGQLDVEEVNVVVSGGNYGWNWKEGSFGFYDYQIPNGPNPPTTITYVSQTQPPGLPMDVIDPLAEYDHDDGIAITGGYVYRGTQMLALQGSYIFADWSQRLLYLDGSDQINEFMGAGINEYITGFGEDGDQELYLVTNETFNPSGVAGRLLKLQAIGAEYSPPEVVQEETAQCPPSEEICAPIKAANGNIAMVCL